MSGTLVERLGGRVERGPCAAVRVDKHQEQLGAACGDGKERGKGSAWEEKEFGCERSGATNDSRVRAPRGDVRGDAPSADPAAIVE